MNGTVAIVSWTTVERSTRWKVVPGLAAAAQKGLLTPCPSASGKWVGRESSALKCNTVLKSRDDQQLLLGCFQTDTDIYRLSMSITSSTSVSAKHRQSCKTRHVSPTPRTASPPIEPGCLCNPPGSRSTLSLTAADSLTVQRQILATVAAQCVYGPTRTARAHGQLHPVRALIATVPQLAVSCCA